MTKPAKTTTPKRSGKPPRATVVKRTPAHRLALIITPVSITLAEKSGQNIRQEEYPFGQNTVFSTSGLINQEAFILAVKDLRTRLNTKTKHVDLHIPMGMVTTTMITIPNVKADNSQALLDAARLSLNNQYSISDTDYSYSLYPTADHPAVTVISARKAALRTLLEAVNLTGLITSAVVPTAITSLAGITPPSSVTAVLHFEPDGNTCTVIKDQRIITIENAPQLGQAATSIATNADQAQAFTKLLNNQDWNPQPIADKAATLIREMNDYLRSIQVPTIDQILLTGSLSHHPLLIDALKERLGALPADQFTPNNTDTLLHGALINPSTDPLNPRSINLLTPDVKVAQPSAAPNIGILLPVAVTVGWVTYSTTVMYQHATTSTEARDKQVTLTELQRFASEQQALQVENTRMTTTLAMRGQIEAASKPWPDIIRKFTNNIPLTNKGFAATVSSFDVREDKPDGLKYGSLNVAYAYDITVDAPSRSNLLTFIAQYSNSPYAIDVQTISQKPDNTWQMQATVGTTK